MPPFVTPLTTMRDAAPGSSYPGVHPTTAAATATATATAGVEQQSRFVHGFNDVGGRPNERRGTRGSFTPGVRIMSGGQAHDVPVDTTEIANNNDPGTVLFVSSVHKPDLSGEARTNVAGGRPTERLGGNSGRRFAPPEGGAAKTFLGGAPRDVPLEDARIANRGKVLFVSSIHKPDISGEARTNASRPAERLGSQGRFTPGVRIMSGGHRRRRPRGGVNPSEVDFTAAVNHGRVLFESSTHKPDLSYLPTFNVAGGRPDERFGTQGSFTRGVRIMSGGEAHDVPVATETANHGTVLFVSSVHKPDLSGGARTNVAGGRPSERLGGHPGRFTRGVRRWRGGEPRDIPAERETADHGTVIFPRPLPSQAQAQEQQRFMSPPSFVTGSSAAGGGDGTGKNNNSDSSDNSGSSDGWFDIETEEITMEEACQAQDADLAHQQSTKTTMERTIIISSSCNDLAKGADGGMMRRCGSDSQFQAGRAPFFSWSGRPSFR